MNIGIVAHFFDRQEGTGGYVAEMVGRLAREHEVTLYAAAVRSPRPEGVHLVHVPAFTARAYTTILTFPAAFASVRRPHDVVHAQGWLTGQADVVTAHIVLAAWRRTARLHGVRPPLGERLLGGWVARREAELYASAGAVIAPSARARDDIAAVTGRTAGVHVVPHGCDRAITPTPRAAARRRWGVPDDSFAAVYIGDPRKGLRAALGGVAAVPDVQLLVLAHGQHEGWADLAEALGIASRVRFAPEGTTAADAFGAADVVFQPTIYDTFGLVVGEALALGLPVVTSAGTGAAELIEHGTSGWVLEGVSPDVTGRALRALQADPALRARLAEGGRTVAARHTWDATVRQTVAVYESVRRS